MAICKHDACCNQLHPKKYVKTKGITTPILYNSLDEEQKRIDLIMSLKVAYPSVLIVGSNNEIQDILQGFSTGIGVRVQKSVQNILDKQ